MASLGLTNEFRSRVDGRSIDSFQSTQKSNWVAFTPSMVPQTVADGLGATALSAGKYLLLNEKVVLVSYVVEIPSSGTQSGQPFTLSLPPIGKPPDTFQPSFIATGAFPGWPFSGIVTNSGGGLSQGSQVTGFIQVATPTIILYQGNVSGSGAIANNNTYAISGFYGVT